MPKYKVHLSVTAIHELYDYVVEAETPEEAEKRVLADETLSVSDFTNDKVDYLWESLKADDIEEDDGENEYLGSPFKGVPTLLDRLVAAGKVMKTTITGDGDVIVEGGAQ